MALTSDVAIPHDVDAYGKVPWILSIGLLGNAIDYMCKIKIIY